MISKNGNAFPGNVHLSSRFRYADHRLFVGRARLYEDRMVLHGLSWRGFHQRTILLRNMVRVRWHAGSERAANVTLFLYQGEQVQLRLSGAGLWKYSIDERLGKRLGVAEDLPGIALSVSAA